MTALPPNDNLSNYIFFVDFELSVLWEANIHGLDLMSLSLCAYRVYDNSVLGGPQNYVSNSFSQQLRLFDVVNIHLYLFEGGFLVAPLNG
jgi:hypothetical protein